MVEYNVTINNNFKNETENGVFKRYIEIRKNSETGPVEKDFNKPGSYTFTLKGSECRFITFKAPGPLFPDESTSWIELPKYVNIECIPLSGRISVSSVIYPPFIPCLKITNKKNAKWALKVSIPENIRYTRYRTERDDENIRMITENDNSTIGDNEPQ